MHRYLHLLANKNFAVLWLGATISFLGDALTWTAMTWLVYELTGTTEGVGWLVVIYTAPVFIGGFIAGILLDRFDRRVVLMADNAIRGAFIGAIPVLHWLGKLELWHIYLAAGIYGLMKMHSLAGIPAMIPALVDKEHLATANAMESIMWGVSGVLGPALAGILIVLVGSANTIALDAASYFVFVACIALLPRIDQPARPPKQSSGLVPAIQFVRAQPAIWFIVAMFICANIGMGMLMVLLPVYTKQILNGDAATFGTLLSIAGISGLIGSVVIGGMAWKWTLGRSIAAVQLFIGASYFPLLVLPGLGATLVILVLSHFFDAPLTIWAQTIRMRLIPPELRGRVFGLLRTVMQSALPLGGALGTTLLTNADIPITILIMALVIAIPGAIGLIHPALDHRHTIAVEAMS